jgi:PAS domain S-box-containing protein
VIRSAVRPTGVERTFAPDELIVSKTDLKGRLTYANDVFLRVSAFDEHEVVGKPHNIIRHPAMPRCIFALLWETLEAGDEMFAYVVNLAADGAHYWVLAHVTPSLDEHGTLVGYHSNRRVPDRRAVATIEHLYGRLVGIEKRHSSPKEAIAASSAQLTADLAHRGQSYDEFVWSLAGAAA